MLSLQLNKESYSTDDKTIQGTVKFVCKEDEVMISGIIVHFCGFEQLTLNRSTTLKKSYILQGWQALVGRKEDYAEHEDGTPDLNIKGYQEPHSLSGTNEWDFIFEIPSHIPPSARFAEKASIEYFVKASVMQVFGETIHETKEVQIGDRIMQNDLEAITTRVQTQGPYYFRHQIDPNVTPDIHISAHVVNGPLVHIGEEIRIIVNLDINLSKHLRVVKAKLRQNYKFDFLGINNMQTLTKVKLSDTEKKLRKGQHRLEIVLPLTHSHLQPSITHSKLISCSHHVQLIIPTQLGDRLTLRVPIYVELLPRATVPVLPVDTDIQINSTEAL